MIGLLLDGVAGHLLLVLLLLLSLKLRLISILILNGNLWLVHHINYILLVHISYILTIIHNILLRNSVNIHFESFEVPYECPDKQYTAYYNNIFNSIFIVDANLSCEYQKSTKDSKSLN